MHLAKEFCEKQSLTPKPMLFYLWGHSYEFDQHDNWPVMEEFPSYISGFFDQIWLASNLEIINYLKTCKMAEMSADGQRIYNPASIPVWLEAEPFMETRRIHRIDPGETVTL